MSENADDADSNVVNLNQFRKKKTAKDKQKKAEENRVKFGRTKLEKESAQTEANKRDNDLNGHKIDE